ncbi:hypothetical protein GDO86_009861 [Hymenochirus boettgeri]|nr:hypothetical protein GDO86_009861 [Hymenochirus boettgeri]
MNGPLSSALTIAEDDHWKRIRSVLSPTFTSGRLKEMFQIIKKYSDALMENVLVYVNNNQPCVLKDVVGAYSMDVITSTSFGVNIDSLNKPSDPFVTHIKKLLKMGIMSPLIILVVIFPFLIPIFEAMNVQFLSKEFTNFFMNAVTSFQKNRMQGDHSGRVDLLQLMVDSRTVDEKGLTKEQKALTDSEIMAQSIIFIVAGYETTSTALSYLFYNLAIHPDVQQKLHEEIDLFLPDKASPTYDILMQMDYFDMVIQETLRLYPPAGRLERVSRKTVEINGVIIPKGTVTMIPTFVLQRDPEYWPEPDEFHPERFSKDNRQNHTPFTFLPFGDGPRNCIGMRFALLSIKVAATVLLQNFTVQPCAETMIPVEFSPIGLLQPKKPIQLKFLSRATTHI